MLADALTREYKRMLDRWSSGGLYYHYRSFLKRYTLLYLTKFSLAKKYVCGVLAIARLGMPITSNLLAWLTGTDLNLSLGAIEHLSSLKVVEPLDPIVRKGVSGAPLVRRFKLTEEFIRHVYMRLSEVK